MDKSNDECASLLWWLMGGFRDGLKLYLMPLFPAPKKSIFGKYRYPKELYELHEILSNEISRIRTFSNKNNFSAVKFHCESLFKKIEIHCNNSGHNVPKEFVELKVILTKINIM